LSVKAFSERHTRKMPGKPIPRPDKVLTVQTAFLPPEKRLFFQENDFPETHLMP
jgi:hypothetical protein